MTPAHSCCSASSPQPTNAARSASDRTGPSNNGADSYPNTPPPSACSTGCSITPTSSSPKATPTACVKPEHEEVQPPKRLDQPKGWGLLLGHQRGPQLGR